MFRLVYSNRTEALLTELSARVRAQQAQVGPLTPVRIVVPSAGVESYVRLGIARACGVAANLDVTPLKAFAESLVASTAGERAVRAADASVFEAMALAVLLDDDADADAELEPVRAYLRAAGDRPEGIDVRRVQLASRIGRLFENYTYARPDMLTAWREGSTLDRAAGDTEAWQRRIYGRMFDGRGAPGGSEIGRAPGAVRARVVPLHEAVEALDVAGIRAALPHPVHVFAFAHVARTFHALLERLAQATDVVVYALSPCEGFWEDVDPRDPPPIRLWGRPGRDQIRALNAMAGFDHEDHFVDSLDDPRAPTLLRRLQSDLLHRQPADGAQDGAQDGVQERVQDGARESFEHDESIVVLEHANVRRELEAAASEIWRLLEQDDTLRFDDVALLVPEADESYLAHLPAAFREAHDLPYQLVGVPIAGGAHVVEAIELLLALPGSRFTRRDLLELAVHPAVIASLEDVDPQRWVAWCEALGVVHGADREDHDGTYIERDIFNWDQGLRRLALGAFMTGDASGARAAFMLGEDGYVPLEIMTSELHDAATFGVLLRSLLGDARFARDASLTPQEWARFLCTLIETYVSPAAEGDEEHLTRCLRRVRGLAEVDLGGRRVGYRVAYELARKRLRTAPVGRGGEGVVVSTLAAIRPLPFRVVFACGLGEGRFPAPEGEDPLDLRWVKRRSGDVTPRERDRYAFLELLLGARDRLYASYVSRDPLTGDALSPSSVVHELLHTVVRPYVRDPSALCRRHPLRRWDPRYFPELFGGEPSSLGTMRIPEARAEATTLAVRRSFERAGARVDRALVEARAATEDPAWVALARHLGIARLPETFTAAEGRIVIPMYALVKFLELPLQGWARLRVGLDEDSEDYGVMVREDEPFETHVRDETLLLRQVLLDARGRSLEEAYDTLARGRELRGEGPSGVFARGERAAHLSTLETWKRELEANHLHPDRLEIHRLGGAGEHSRADRVHPSLVLDVEVVDPAGVARRVSAEIRGRTLPRDPEAGVGVTLLRRQWEPKDEWAVAGRERSAIRALVDHAVLSATGEQLGEAPASLVVVATPDAPVTDRAAFRPMSRDGASAWLRSLVRELLGKPHAYFLPCEAVFVHRRRDADAPIGPCVEEARDKVRDSDGVPALRSAYGPVPRPHEYPLPDEAALREMVAERFSAFFAPAGDGADEEGS